MTLIYQPTAIASEPSDEPRAFRWTRDDYYRLYDLGMFEDRRVELIDGQVFVKPAQSARHAWSISAAAETLRAAAGEDFCVRPQMPLDFSPWSDPEPDVAVLAGDLDSWHGKDTPTTAVIVVEVSDKTLLFDRRVKPAIYAAAGLQEYWIINLVDRRLEVHRDPRPDPQNVRASRYADVTTWSPKDVVSPLAFPAARIVVEDLLG